MLASDNQHHENGNVPALSNLFVETMMLHECLSQLVLGRTQTVAVIPIHCYWLNRNSLRKVH